MKRWERRIGRFDSRDYPVLVWLAKSFEDSGTVLDLGGNVGIGYYAYGPYLSLSRISRWLVCEIPEFCEAGREIAKVKQARGLEFTEKFADGDGADILLTCGALQYIETPLSEMISSLKHKPKHVLIQRVPMSNKPTFYTLENIRYAICPYRIQNRKELVDSLDSEGYRLIDTWKDTKECRIPFNPSRTVHGYSGAYFQRKTD